MGEIVYGGWLEMGDPTGILALISARHLDFCKRNQSKVIWLSSVLAVIGMLWMKRTSLVFEDYKGAGVE